MENICYLDDLLVVAVATNTTDDYYRFLRSLNIYRYKYEVFIEKRNFIVKELRGRGRKGVYRKMGESSSASF